VVKIIAKPNRLSLLILLIPFIVHLPNTTSSISFHPCLLLVGSKGRKCTKSEQKGHAFLLLVFLQLSIKGNTNISFFLQLTAFLPFHQHHHHHLCWNFIGGYQFQINDGIFYQMFTLFIQCVFMRWLFKCDSGHNVNLNALHSNLCGLSAFWFSWPFPKNYYFRFSQQKGNWERTYSWSLKLLRNDLHPSSRSICDPMFNVPSRAFIWKETIYP